MIAIDDLLATIPSLQRSDLEGWIRDELVIAERDAGLSFSDMECARIRLICTLTYELEIDSGALPVVLSLLDQLYDTRQRLLSLNESADTAYADEEKVREEITQANRLFVRMKWPTIDVSRRSVEETAAAILNIIQEHER
jgi:chaperone modulatory protein CbpM